ncbi:MAG: argininosuccinate lyase [Gemmatimonadetes bacterium]|nr:MAG: argininosuccinate lyase [Gemmatimonadota bacterium]PYO76054.1 MAG: argininosuccinate lyase [Gemmatimonadota bacterium]
MSDHTSHKLWGGRFSTPSAAALESLNRSIGTDYRLWPFDISLSQAWAVALWGAGVLTLEESKRIERGLGVVGQKLAAGAQPLTSDEDVHTLIDRMLHEEVGDIASKLHTGRSRNDQVATATRLWSIDACTKLDASARSLQQVMLDQAASLEDVLMPAYTHLQRAQPVSAAHWMLSHFWPLERDRARIASASRAAAVLPLGAGAIAGCAFPISRVLLQGSLGFTSLSQNSIDAVGDRDFVAELLFTVAMIATHVSRLAEDLIIYGSSEFGFVQFGDAFTTGSSMMPQKRNPDALELARGSGARAIGDLATLLATLKGLPSGYNKDLQDDKRVLFDGVDTVLLVLPAVAGALQEIRFNAKRMRAAISSSMMATDLADYLVEKGASFREAHAAIGELIRESEQEGCELDALPLSSFKSAHSLFGDDILDWLDPARSVARRDVPGGTGPTAVAAQIRAAREALWPVNEIARGNELVLRAI